MIANEPQPDQRPLHWDDHVLVYEAVFEPFSAEFAEAAVAAMGLKPGARVLDVGCGCGAVALTLAERAHVVTAIDAAGGMIDRVKARAIAAQAAIDARVMDGQDLRFGDAAFDAALSVFGVILFPNAARGLAEMRRVVKPGGCVAVVTWTEPQNYVLATELRAAIHSIKPDLPSSALPAQLRYRERADFEALFHDAGFADVEIRTLTAHLKAPSARWLADRLAFAPGMAAMMAGLGDAQAAVLDAFVGRLEAAQGAGGVALSGVAFAGVAVVA